jgi:hypothetical protein
VTQFVRCLSCHRQIESKCAVCYLSSRQLRAAAALRSFCWVCEAWQWNDEMGHGIADGLWHEEWPFGYVLRRLYILIAAAPCKRGREIYMRIEPGAAPPVRAHTCAMLCIPARRITLNASGPTPRSRSSRLGNICECSSGRVQKSDGIGAHCESRADLGAPKAGASAS